jgi:hypothetical protein
MARRGPWLGTPARIALTLFVACVWLNQSVGGKDWEDLRDAVFAAPSRHPLQAARYPFVFLYRRSLDERYYYETAAAILGRQADGAVVRQMHGKMPEGFPETLPAADGQWHAPYTEVPLEYPPLNLPFFVLPRAIVSTFAAYGYVFGALMGLCLVGAIAAAIGAARRGGAGDREVQTKWLLATGLLLAQGALAVQRLDPIAALFLGLAMLAAAGRRPFFVGLTLGLAGAAKILPLLVLPAVVASDRASYRGRRPLARLGAGLAVALALGFAPLVASPRAFVAMLRYHAARGLNVESTLGIALGIVRALSGHTQAAPASFGSQNLVGASADLLAKLTMPLLFGCTAWLVWRLAREAPGPLTERGRVARVAASALAATTILWLTSKVLSPQYLTWCIPLVLAVPGRAGARLAWVAIVAMIVTQLYTRGYYDLVVEQAPVALLTLAVRQALLFVLLAMAVKEVTKTRQAGTALP